MKHLILFLIVGLLPALAVASPTNKLPNGMLREYSFYSIKDVNDYVNSYPYKYDKDLYGRDYLATAKEFFENGGGDCEDYAVAKAALILGLDIAQPDEVELWVLYKVPESLHAVLAVKAGDNEYFVLDNANDSIERVKKYSIYRGYILLESYSYSRGVPQNP